MSFGDNVRRAREAAGMTQLELARLSGYGRTSITNIESDRQDPSLTGIHAMADALQIRPGLLFADPDDLGLHAEALATRAAVRKALRMLDWEIERLTNTAQSLSLVARTLRSSLEPASGDTAASVAE